MSLYEKLLKQYVRARTRWKEEVEELTRQCNTARTNARAWKAKVADLSNSYASWAYNKVVRQHYTAGRAMYMDALHFAPERNTEMVSAMQHNIGFTYEKQRKCLDAVVWYSFANETAPKNNRFKGSYQRAVKKYMKS